MDPINLPLVIVLVFILGIAAGMALNERVLKPWARRQLGRPLECDQWGLPEQWKDGRR